MTDRQSYRGSMTAIITPFDASGAVDESALCAFIDWQIEEGTKVIVPVGTTGESATLTHDEHKQVTELVVSHVAGRVPVMAGAGSNNTVEAVDFAVHAEQAGADSILAVTPYYNRPAQRGLYAHFAAMAEAVKIPIFIYNIPARSVVDMTPETMGQLARDYANIWGVKDAVGSMERASIQRMICGKNFIQLSAEDATSLGYNAHGGVGAISVTANVAPRLCCEFQDATLAGDYAKALEYQDRLMPLHKALFIEPGVAGAKYALAKLGKAENYVRSPILPVETSTQTAIDDALRHAGLLN